MKYNAKMWKGFCNYEMDFAMKGWAARPRLYSLTNMTLATWHCHDDTSRHDEAWQHDRKSEGAAHNFLFAGKEGVALEALRPVDGDEGEHVGEGGVGRAVGDPGQGHG